MPNSKTEQVATYVNTHRRSGKMPPLYLSLQYFCNITFMHDTYFINFYVFFIFL